MENKLFTIEALLQLNKKLSYYNLVIKKHPVPQLLLVYITIDFILFVLCLASLVLAFSLKQPIWLLVTIGTLLLLIYFFRKINNQIQFVYTTQYKQEKERARECNLPICVEIRKNVVKKEIGDLLNKESILFFIESLKREDGLKRYSFNFLSIMITIMGSAYLGSLLGSLATFAHDFDEYLKIIRIMSIIVIVSILFVFALEFLFKIGALEIRQGKNRLIRALENIYIELEFN